MEDEGIVSLIIGVTSTGLAITAFVKPTLRLLSTVILISLLGVLLLILKLQQLHSIIKTTRTSCSSSNKKIDKIIEQFDIHKKIYKIETEIRNMRLKRKGSIDPLWGIAVMAIIILIVFILMAIGIIPIP